MSAREIEQAAGQTLRTKFRQPSFGTNAVTFLPFLMSWTRTHLRMAELGCLASTPTCRRRGEEAGGCQRVFTPMIHEQAEAERRETREANRGPHVGAVRCDTAACPAAV